MVVVEVVEVGGGRSRWWEVEEVQEVQVGGVGS